MISSPHKHDVLKHLKKHPKGSQSAPFFQKISGEVPVPPSRRGHPSRTLPLNGFAVSATRPDYAAPWQCLLLFIFHLLLQILGKTLLKYHQIRILFLLLLFLLKNLLCVYSLSEIFLANNQKRPIPLKMALQHLGFDRLAYTFTRPKIICPHCPGPLWKTACLFSTYMARSYTKPQP